VSGRPDDGSSLRRRPDQTGSAGQPFVFGGRWLLRVASVVPFVMIGAVAAAAAVVLPLMLILGLGSSRPIWRAAHGRSARGYLLSLAEVIGLELVPLGVLRLSILATSHGVKAYPRRWFFPVVLAVSLAGAAALVVLKAATPAQLTRAGLPTTHWLALLLIVGGTAVLAALRVRQAREP
jgi:hypothetical protein